MRTRNRFPLLFGRKGGASLSVLKVLNAPSCDKYITQIIKLSDEIAIAKNDLMESLYVAINEEENSKEKNLLLNLKRDLFNDKKLEKHFVLINNNAIQPNFNKYLDKLQLYFETKQKFKTNFEKELFKTIENLKKITNDYFFRNGLLFSSAILSNEIQKSSFKFSSLNKTDKRLINSTLKYLTRSVTKTTPFSSFNTIFCLELAENDTVYIPIKTGAKPSFFQITGLFYHYLKEILLKNESFKDRLGIHCNETVWETTEQETVFHFFINKENNETFKKLDKSVILQFIKEQLANNECHLDLLLNTLEKETGEARDTVRSFVDVLINEGFLQISYPVSNTDKDWIQKLLVFIKSQIDFSPEFQKTTKLLDAVLQTIDELQNNFNVEKRKKVIDLSYKSITNSLISWDPQTDFLKKVQPQDLFYEDTFANDSENIEVRHLDVITHKLKEAYRFFNSAPLKTNIKKELGKQLKAEHNGRLPILQFYEKIYLKFNNETILETIDLEVFRKLYDKIESLLNEERVNPLISIDILDLLEPSKLEIKTESSFGVYFQSTDATLKDVVVNSFFNGYGSNISRFLHLLPEAYSERVLQHNKYILFDKKIADVKDASIHNINTIPPLSEYVISICEDYALKEKYKLIPLSNIYVSCNEDDGIVVIDNNGTEIQPIVFSLESLKRKSKFTQFFDIFNPLVLFDYTFFKENLRQLFENKLSDRNVMSIPRIIFGKGLIIQRKMWLIKKEHLLILLDKNKKTADEIFLNINLWIAQNEIPTEVFVTISKRQSVNNQGDSYKPQYINFKSPVFVLLFSNMIDKADDIIEITEIYPNTSQVERNGGYVKEYVLNVN